MCTIVQPANHGRNEEIIITDWKSFNGTYKINQLFVITGASCIGKSTACKILFAKEKDYIEMESDLFWSDIYYTPENGYKEFRELLLNVCGNISQIGIPHKIDEIINLKY